MKGEWILTEIRPIGVRLEYEIRAESDCSLSIALNFYADPLTWRQRLGEAVDARFALLGRASACAEDHRSVGRKVNLGVEVVLRLLPLDIRFMLSNIVLVMDGRNTHVVSSLWHTISAHTPVPSVRTGHHPNLVFRDRRPTA